MIIIYNSGELDTESGINQEIKFKSWKDFINEKERKRHHWINQSKNLVAL